MVTHLKSGILILFLIVTACSTKTSHNIVRYFNNEFNDGSKNLLTQSFQLSKTQMPVEQCVVTYEKSSEDQNKLNLFFALKRKELSFDLSKKLIVRADSKLYSVNIERIHSQFSSERTITNSTTNTTDSTGTFSFSNSDESRQNWYLDKFLVTLNKEMKNAIESCNNLSIRFYLGPEPVTISYSTDQLGKLKELIKSKLID